MSYHILSIDAYTCHLSCDKGQLRCADGENSPRTIPLEDVGAVVLSSFKATLTSNLLIELARKRIGFVLCESYRPAVLLLPADRSTDTGLLRHLADMPARLRNRLWQKDFGCQVWESDGSGPSMESASSRHCGAEENGRDGKDGEGSRVRPPVLERICGYMGKLRFSQGTS